FVRVPLQVEQVSASRTAAVQASNDLPASFLHGTVANSVRRARNGHRAKILGHPSGKNGSRAVMTPEKAVVSFVRVPLQVEKVSESRSAAALVTSDLPASFLHETVGSVHRARNGSRVKMLGHSSVKSGSHAARPQAKGVASFAHAVVPSPGNA